MQKILISGCLLGAKVRYNGEDKLIEHQLVNQWIKEGRFVSVCPEMAGGLPTPRPAAEMTGHQVLTKQGADVTAEFQKGAEIALRLCQQHGIKLAILKARSPSCGNEAIYDGTFSGRTIPGQGVTAALLTEHGIQVFNEDQLLDAANFLAQREFSHS
jgi:uncharacterized protein YbbK (DUF523 family)